MASLAGLEAGDPYAVRRIVLVHALILGFGGIPVIWMGDELGLLNDHEWAARPEQADDNRWVHRPRMPWPLPPDAHGIRGAIQHLARARADLPHLHGAVPTQVLDPHDPSVLLVARVHPLGSMLGAYNIKAEPRHVPLDVLHALGLDPGAVVDRISGKAPEIRDDAVQLEPYAAVWLVG
jgi:amylosucrase